MRRNHILMIGACTLAMLACMGQTAAGLYAAQHYGNQYQTFYSIPLQDGWVLESSENSDVGDQLDRDSTTLRVGDGALRNQYRAILSFDTSPLPDDAIITGASLILKQQGVPIAGGNPFTDFRGLLVDVKWGSFGVPRLDADDFQALSDVSSFGPYKPSLSDSYTFPLRAAAYPLINKWLVSGGLTQFRLRFKLDDNGDGGANYVQFSSGNEPVEALRPQLLIEYRLPSRIEIGWLPDPEN